MKDDRIGGEKMGIKVGIIGATGYVGEELVRILCRHPQVTGMTVASKDAPGQPLSRVYPHLAGFADMEILDMDRAPELISGSDLVFSALPHGLSAPVAREALAAGKRVIDMAADFRLPDQALYEQWYQAAHEAPDLLGEAVYGLPELFRSAVSAARLVANPGCFPTSALLALAPLMKHGLVEQDSLIVDSKSGVSGAGRTLALGSHYSECNDNVRAYSVAAHRHTPEISHYASVLAGSRVEVVFTPHLVPMTRGILSTVYAGLLRPMDAASLRQVYRDFYSGEEFIQLLGEGEWPETKWVQGTNRCCLGLTVAGRKRLIVVSVIDNLVKGAAGQAVQNMNLMFDLPEGMGLNYPGLYP
ncbi:MAG: N-acetyl-gamma-glutamyl-phosphate reductase [Thermacetogeniaceae bacterium]